MIFKPNKNNEVILLYCLIKNLLNQIMKNEKKKKTNFIKLVLYCQ